MPQCLIAGVQVLWALVLRVLDQRSCGGSSGSSSRSPWDENGWSAEKVIAGILAFWPGNNMKKQSASTRSREGIPPRFLDILGYKNSAFFYTFLCISVKHSMHSDGSRQTACCQGDDHNRTWTWIPEADLYNDDNGGKLTIYWKHRDVWWFSNSKSGEGILIVRWW